MSEYSNLFKELNGYNWSMTNSLISKVFNRKDSLWARSIKYFIRYRSDVFQIFQSRENVIIRVCQGGSVGVVVQRIDDGSNFKPNIPFSIVMSEVI